MIDEVTVIQLIALVFRMELSIRQHHFNGWIFARQKKITQEQPNYVKTS